MSGVVDLTARARAGASAPRGWRTALRAGLVAAVLAAVGWVLLASSLLAVDEVEVAGAARLSVEQVREAASVVPGTPLARVDVEAVRGRVAALAPVAAVEVVRAWPGTLRLEVTERTAVAWVAAPGGVQLVDAEGVAFARERERPAGVVRLQAERPGRADPATRAGLAVLAELPGPLRERLAIVRAHAADRVSLVLRDGREVVWGPPGRAEEKAATALALLRLPGTLYDVTSPQVAVRRQPAEAAADPPAG